MKKFVIKAVVFLSLMFVMAFLLQKLIDRGLRKDDSGKYKEWNDIFFSRINAQILIQGSSRAYRHISPRLIDSAFKMNSYNLGLSGYDFLLQYYRFMFYLKYNKTPDYIVQSIDPATLRKGDTLVDYLQYLPYLNDSNIQRAVQSFQGMDWKDFYIPLYKYHGIYQVAFQGIVDNFKVPSNNNGKYKGFQPGDLKWNDEFEKFKRYNPNGYRILVNSSVVGLFNQFLNFCKLNNIKVIFVCAPEYYESQKLLLNRDSIMNIFRYYSASYNIPLLDYSNDSICFSKANFYNSQHLNLQGVTKFNRKLVASLKHVIK